MDNNELNKLLSTTLGGVIGKTRGQYVNSIDIEKENIRKEANNMIDDIEANDKRLSEWETEFVATVSFATSRNEKISSKQLTILRGIHAKTSL